MLHALLALLLAFANLSDADALQKLQGMYGNTAMIGHARNGTDTYWVKQLGVESIGCNVPFTILATGSNTWDDAFLQLDATPPVIAGPFAQALTITMSAWDDMGVIGFLFYVDGVPRAPSVQPPAAPKWTVVAVFATSALADGIHVLCGKANDAAGNAGASKAFLFATNQATGTIAASWTPSQMAAPVISAP